MHTSKYSGETRLNPSNSKLARLAIGAMLAGLACLAGAQESPTVGKGQRYYERVCAKCHEAGIGPVIKGRGFPEMTYMVIVRNGFNAMPAFRVTDIDDDTLKDLASYLSKTPVKK